MRYASHIRSEPASQKVADVEAFLINKLNNDTPVFMHNLFEITADTQYMLNEQSSCNYSSEIGSDTDFDNHWMTITKYYRNNQTGDTFVAFSSWGCRYTININLLKDKNATKFYPDFYTYEILPKA